MDEKVRVRWTLNNINIKIVYIEIVILFAFIIHLLLLYGHIIGLVHKDIGTYIFLSITIPLLLGWALYDNLKVKNNEKV